jgi:hypothetical protein
MDSDIALRFYCLGRFASQPAKDIFCGNIEIFTVNRHTSDQFNPIRTQTLTRRSLFYRQPTGGRFRADCNGILDGIAPQSPEVARSAQMHRLGEGCEKTLEETEKQVAASVPIRPCKSVASAA